MRDKRFLLGAVIVLVLLIVGLVVVFVFFGNKQETAPVNDQFPTAGDRPAGTGTTTTNVGEIEQNRGYWAEGEAGTDALPLLRALSDKPVAGSVTILKDDGSGYREEEYARYVERSSGHILDISLGRIEEPTTLSGETMLRIGRVFWSKNGSTTLLQRLDPTGTVVYSYLGSLRPLGTSTTDTVSGTLDFKGKHLEYENVRTAAISPDARSIFYIVATDQGSVGYLEDTISGTKRPVWNSLLTSLTAVWGGKDTVLIYTNPSSVAPGFVWTLNTVTGVSSLLLSNTYALAARMNPAGNRVLYSLQETSGGITSLRVLTLVSGTVSYIPSGTASIAEKCVWDTVRDTVIYCAIPRNLGVKDYLEDWQYGLLASDDILWQINTETGEAQQILDPVELTTDTFDMVDLEVSPRGDFLVFRNRTNDILWSVHIPEQLLPASEEAPNATSTLSL